MSVVHIRTASVEAVLKSIHNLCFRAEIRKIMYTKDVNEYLNRYLNIRMGIRMGIRIIFEYSMVNDMNFLPP